MKIALLQTPTFPLNIDFHGGIERVELGELDTLEKYGHQATLFVPALVGKRNGIVVIRDLGWRSRVLKWIYYLNFLVKTIGYDIRHGHYTPILILLAPKRSVLHFHGLAIRELPLYRFAPVRRRYKDAHYIFCARWVKAEFVKMYPDFPEGNMHVVYNGCDTITVQHKAYVKDARKINICWYGLWEEEKGIFHLLEAVRILERKRTDFKVVIGGSANLEGGSDKAHKVAGRVREVAATLRTVELTGLIKRDGLSQFLADKDVGLFPSIYRDPFPLVPLEMMAAGLPVIAFDYGGPREAIIDGQTGFLVENMRPEKLAEKIEFFLDNRSEIERMGRAAREHVEKNFTWEKHIEQLIEIYKGIVKGKR
jgi:glycosyltransferase involved in cell wall biosynthesis